MRAAARYLVAAARPESIFFVCLEHWMILITGGTGYVGSRLVEKLRARNEPLRLLVRDPERARGSAGSVELARGDVTDPASLAAAAEGADTIINLVAIIRER